MSETKHTPGPWEYDWYDEHVSFSSPEIQYYFMRIEFSDNLECGEWDGDKIANARLVAAAPELLEACEELLHEVCIFCHTKEAKGCNPDCWVNKHRKTIAKAKGENQ